MNCRLLSLALVATFFAAIARSEPVVDEAGHFSAKFPGVVQRGSQSVDTAVGKVTMNMVYQDAGAIAYMIIYNDYPAGSVASSGGAEKVYENAVNGATSNVHGNLRSNSACKIGQVQGREIIVDIPAQKPEDKSSAARVRFLLVGDRLYQVMYIGPAGKETGEDATSFLDSFRLLP